jgi:hypothetical protein
LFTQGDRFIFNGNMDEGRAAQFVPAEHLGHYPKTLTIPVGYEYWERRGVFVMRASLSLLNDVARQYIGRHTLGVPS